MSAKACLVIRQRLGLRVIYARYLIMETPVCSTDELQRGYYSVVLYNDYFNAYRLTCVGYYLGIFINCNRHAIVEWSALQ